MLKIEGKYEFFDKSNNLIYEKHNAINKNIFEYILKSLKGDAVPGIEANYLALGIGTITATETDTKLESESVRYPLTSSSWNAKSFTALYSLKASESNFYINEIGLFANATGTKDSGDLLSRANVAIDKNSNQVYNIIYTLTLSEV